MAVSLAQYSRAVQSRPRSSTVPSRMQPYNPSEVISMPAPEQFAHQLAPPPQQYRHSYTSAPAQWQPPQQLQRQQCTQQSPWKLQHSPIYYTSPAELEASQEFGHSQRASRESTDSTSTTASSSAPSWTTSIEPDPLPPHSNPQALTQTQSSAFSSSAPIPPVHIGIDEIRSNSTGLADFRIHREASRMPSFLSSKPVITVTKVSSACTVGVIRFHTLLPASRIDVAIDGHETSISHSGMIHNRWAFHPTSTSSSSKSPGEREKWYWKRDRSTGGAMLGDSKWNGNVLARMKGDLLTFEKPRLSVESYDEIVVSAVAMAEAARRNKRKGDVVDIASAIGDFTSHEESSATGDSAGDG